MIVSRRSILSLPLVLAPWTMAAAQGLEGLTPFPLKPKRSADAEGRSTSSASTNKTIDKRIAGIVAQVDGARLMADVKTLQAFGTRHSHSSKNIQAANWLHDAFVARGYSKDRVKRQTFHMPVAGARQNILLWPKSNSASFIVICAHLDSIALGSGGSAPGADDNATGIATLLEVARVVQNVGMRSGILLAAFNGEEQGLFGSQACAQIAVAERWPIDVIINLDMVGYVSSKKPSTIVVEYDQGNVSARNDAASKRYALQMAQAAADYTTLTVEHTNIWSSDYIPFEAKGVPCVGLYDEGADEVFYHSSTDTLINVDRARLTQIARLVIASSLLFCTLI
jgi:Peptidase family M28